MRAAFSQRYGDTPGPAAAAAWDAVAVVLAAVRKAGTSNPARVRDALELASGVKVLQGTLDMLILKVVALGPIHGYAIAQRIRRMSHDVLQVQQGSLYPALHRLENRQWLRARWQETESGRSAKFYELTKARQRQLKAEEADWSRLAAAIGLIMRAAE